MTWALCLSCGNVKFGAICPCPNCQVSSAGDMSLDIAFSDHHISKGSLEQLGKVIAAIHSASNDDQLCFWAFIHYVATNHPQVLGVKLEDDVRMNVESLLAGINLPNVTVSDSAMRAHIEDSSANPPAQKQWWQFWK